MNDYISRDDTKNALLNKGQHTTRYRLGETWELNFMEILEALNAIPAADVQPVDRWISVKDRLPEPEKDVLIWYRNTWGAGFTSYRFGISRWYSNIKRWYGGCLPKDIEVLYWQPLPEPPKEDDT